MLYMDIEICTVSGYNEVGRNMTAVRIEDEVILLDMGVFLPAIIDLEESIEAGEKKLSTDDLIKIKAIPDDTVIKDWKNKVNLLNVTHSTMQSRIIAIHTKKRVILYVNDFKLDDHPIIGDKTNFKRLKELSKEGVLCMIVECLYANRDMKTPSEKVAREMLKDF